MDFSVTENKKLISAVSNFILQPTFRKPLIVKMEVHMKIKERKKEHYAHNYLKSL